MSLNRTEPVGAVVTLRDVWLEVVRCRDDLAKMNGNTADIADHEARLRSVERWRYGMPTALVLAFGSVGVTVASLVLK